MGSAVSSLVGFRGGAPAEIEFGVFQPQNLTYGGNNFDDFLEKQLIKYRAV